MENLKQSVDASKEIIEKKKKKKKIIISLTSNKNKKHTLEGQWQTSWETAYLKETEYVKDRSSGDNLRSDT